MQLQLEVFLQTEELSDDQIKLDNPLQLKIHFHRYIRDCINAIEEGDTDSLSSYEVNALREFKELGDEIKRLDIDIDLILEEYDI